MSRAGAIAAVMLAACLLASPALAGWRDYMGKTLIFDAQTDGRTETDVVTARGGASSTDDIYKNDCRLIYHAYFSGKGRLFLHSSRSHCRGTDPYTSDQASGSVYDLTVSSGLTEATETMPPLPYSVSQDGDELVIEQPQTDYSWKGGGYITTLSGSSGGYQIRLRLGAECGMSMEGELSYRYEFDSTTSDFYTLQDTHSTYTLEAQGCQVVDGFRVK